METQMLARVAKLEEIIEGERGRQDYGDLEALKASIQNYGVIQSFSVQELEDGKLLLIAGGRRFRACKELGITEVPVRIYKGKLSDTDVKEMEIEENFRRKDLTWQEEVAMKQKLHELKTGKAASGQGVVMPDGRIDRSGWNIQKTAELTGSSRSAVHRDLKLASALERLPELAQAKSKAEAEKKLEKLEEQLILAELAKRAEAANSETTGEGEVAPSMWRKRLMDYYCIGNFFEKVSNIRNETIDFCEVDPPFGIDYARGKKFADEGNRDTEDYNEIPAKDYENFLDSTFQECYRVLKKDSWMICWFAMEPWFETVYQSIKKNGFKVTRLAAIWAKTDGTPGQTKSPESMLGSKCEFFFYARKGNATINRAGRSNLYLYPTIPMGTRVHPTEKPIELIQDVLDTFCLPGSTILVPFLGSGNTILAASNLNMTAFGFDLSTNYRNAYIRKVSLVKEKAIFRSLKEGKA